MAIFEFVLILLALVIVSSVLDQIITRLSLPLLQIAVGLVLALFIPRLQSVHLDSELFLVLFIAPLLFREARETDRRMLWQTKWSVLSLAIALVIVSVLTAGYVLHIIIPSIPLAAAFACAAALGPTDAAAVSALGQTISLDDRQKMLLSGEALINDASGVVSFQFAIAAAVTGAFSLTEATGSFAVLFFGGIAIGIVMGFFARITMAFLRRRGYVSTTVHVIYEVLSPFLFFLIAEEVGVSGILAVVAAGLVMQEQKSTIVSPDLARKQMVSGSFWEVIEFLINGIIFVMLGMQLPKVMQAKDMEGVSVGIVLLAMFAVTLTITVIRFLWLFVMEKNPKSALVTTIAGPKGAVTLSIIMTIPLTLEDGTAFPHRDLIVFLTSGVILCTLLLANFVLPRLAPKQIDICKQEMLDDAREKVLAGVITETGKMIDEAGDSEYVPAARLTLMRYRTRLMRLRFEKEGEEGVIRSLIEEVLDVQQQRADEIQADAYDMPVSERIPYYDILRGIRVSVGYFDGAEKIGSRFENKKGRMAMIFAGIRRREFDDEKAARIYYDTCMFAIDLEHAALKFLRGVKEENDPQRAGAADILIGEHEASLNSLWGRINYGQENPSCDIGEHEHGVHERMPEGMRANTGEQFRMARKNAEEVNEFVLNIELDQIRKLRMEGIINESTARELREEVYLLQASFL